MPNQYTPQKRTIGELLSLTNPPILVPDWQRNYSWTSSEAETFWQDLIDFDHKYPVNNIADQEYFLGSVVIVDNGTSHLLLDGQQRLATAGILLSIIRDYLGRFNQDASTRITTRYLSDFDDASNQRIFKLTLNVYDRDFYKREVLESRTADYTAPEPRIQSHTLIREVREVFNARFKRKYDTDQNPGTSHTWALRILQVLVNHVSVVAIISTDEDNASSVFETLNDRGIGLSTPDLLRNLLLRRAAEAEREEIISLWARIFDIDDEVKVDVFLRHYWLSRVGDVKTRSLYREIKDHLITTNESSLLFTRGLADGADAYKNLITAQVEDETAAKYLRDIKDLGASLLYPLLLSAYNCNNNEGFIRICRTAIILYVRHSVIGRLETSTLETLNFNLARDLRSTCEFDQIIAAMIAFAPNNDVFSRQFGEVSVSRRDSARYILRELEVNARTTEELQVAPPSKVHVEHIYPQTPQPGERWTDHNVQINRLGNLTLLDRRLNTAIRNGNFLAKRPAYQQSEILITTPLGEMAEWNQEAISLRQRRFADRALTIWSF
jgi:uncharacterized protein with ParB-like and HNH nuclease domain